MKNGNQALKGFLFGVLVAILLLMVIGAVNRGTGNNTGDKSTLFRSVYASQDGKVVYVCDDDHVYRSIDAGENWTVVLFKTNQPGS
jgi:hypothetical protein